jgi:protocatechuate 3,4-dioxygenase beta subunit
MRDLSGPDRGRRDLIRAMILAPVVLAAPPLLGIAGCSDGADAATDPGDPSAEPTMACVDDDEAEATQAETEGPYFTADSPERTSLLETGMAGTLLTVSGLVLTRSCQPVAGALLDFWQADDSGEYDNEGYRLRGHQFTDATGAFRLETIVPGLYPGRTRHLHVKVQAPGEPILTTQLFFPGEERNASDGIFHASLLMTVSEGDSGNQGTFNFVLDLA